MLNTHPNNFEILESLRKSRFLTKKRRIVDYKYISDLL